VAVGPRKSNSPRGIERLATPTRSPSLWQVQGNLIPQGELKAADFSEVKTALVGVQGNLIPQGELKEIRPTNRLTCSVGTVQGNLIPQGELKGQGLL